MLVDLGIKGLRLARSRRRSWGCALIPRVYFAQSRPLKSVGVDRRVVRPACEDASAPKRAHALHSSRNAVRLSCSGRLVRAGADHCARHRNHSRRITGRSPGQQGRSRRLVVDHPHSFGSGCRDLVFHAKAWRARLTNRTHTDNHIESVRHPRAIPAHEGITSQVTPSVRAKGPVLTKEAGLFWCQSFTPSALRGGISFSRLCLLLRSKPPDRWPDPWRTALQTRTPSFGPAWPRLGSAQTQTGSARPLADPWLVPAAPHSPAWFGCSAPPTGPS